MKKQKLETKVEDEPIIGYSTPESLPEYPAEKKYYHPGARIYGILTAVMGGFAGYFGIKNNNNLLSFVGVSMVVEGAADVIANETLYFPRETSRRIYNALK